jgi:hypothetical protein
MFCPAYKATVDGEPATLTAWTVASAESATLDPAMGAQTSVTASRESAPTITAKVGEGEPTVVKAAALEARTAGKVPLLGTSRPGVTAVIVAFSVAGALTALGTLDGGAFIAFLGPVVGYFFAAAHDSSGAPRAEMSHGYEWCRGRVLVCTRRPRRTQTGHAECRAVGIAVVSNGVSNRQGIPDRQAKFIRNHNPRLGDSSSSSGIEAKPSTRVPALERRDAPPRCCP